MLENGKRQVKPSLVGMQDHAVKTNGKDIVGCRSPRRRLGAA